MTNRSGTLYAGVTRDVVTRVQQHRTAVTRFTARYKIDRLVYYESFDTALEAVALEKQIKGWARKNKIDLINSANPRCKILSEGWYDERVGVQG